MHVHIPHHFTVIDETSHKHNTSLSLDSPHTEPPEGNGVRQYIQIELHNTFELIK